MKFWLKNVRVGDYLGDLSLETKILNWIMKKLHVRVWNGFICLFIWTTGGFLWTWWMMGHNISSKHNYTEYNFSTEFNNMPTPNTDLSGKCQAILHYIWIPFPRFVFYHFLTIYLYLTEVFFKSTRYIPWDTTVTHSKYITVLNMFSYLTIISYSLGQPDKNYNKPQSVQPQTWWTWKPGTTEI